jgi:hypothetical protein
MDYLSHLANKFQRASNASPIQTARFVTNVLAAFRSAPPLAQDALPISLQRSNNMPNNNGSAMPP